MDDITKINNDADLSRYLARIPATPYKQGDVYKRQEWRR